MSTIDNRESIVVSCNAPYDSGGLGRVLADIVGPLETRGAALDIYAGGGPQPPVTVIAPGLRRWLALIPPFRFDPGRRQFFDFEEFDREVARRLIKPPTTTIAFVGQALRTFQRAQTLGCRRLELVAPTPHLNHAWHQHRLALARYPLERDWLSNRHRLKGLAEYELADVIYVLSEYARETFVREGVAAAKLQLLPVQAAPRFVPDPAARNAGGPPFRIVFTGTLTVAKGVPLLLDVLSTIDDAEIELTLVGGTGTRGMKRFIEERCALDRRVRVAPGDPLPHLQRADLYVHPTYLDGFAYAVAEAIACGVPVVCTQDTGAKDLISATDGSRVIPTDSPEALRDAIVAAIAAGRHR